MTLRFYSSLKRNILLQTAPYIKTVDKLSTKKLIYHSSSEQSVSNLIKLNISIETNEITILLTNLLRHIRLYF